VRTSVAVDNGVAYFASGFFPHEGVHLCAVDALSGVRDKASHWQRSYTNQVALQGYLLISASRLYVPGSRSNPFVFDRATGSLLRQCDGAMGTFTLLAGNSFFFGASGSSGPQLTESGLTGDTITNYAGASAAVVNATRTYLLSDTALRALDRGTRQQVWNIATTCSDALILAGTHLFAGGENAVACYAAETGARLWTQAVQGRAFGLAVANGKLYVSTHHGLIYCFAGDVSREQSTWITY
jgi:outer membrane protein assembly factor BamB